MIRFASWLVLWLTGPVMCLDTLTSLMWPAGVSACNRGFFQGTQRWCSDSFICSWDGVICEANRTISGIRLVGSQVRGTIPPEFGSFNTLQTLDLQHNLLEGTIPPSLSNNGFLKEILLNDNQISGRIPSSLSNLDLLETLDLSRNVLEGPLPQELGHPRSLRALRMAGNRFSGTIPESFFSACSGSGCALNELDLSENQIFGTLPSTLGAIESLARLDVRSNQLYGVIPTSIEARAAFLDFDCSNNFMVGNCGQSRECAVTCQPNEFRQNCDQLSYGVCIGSVFYNTQEADQSVACTKFSESLCLEVSLRVHEATLCCRRPTSEPGPALTKGSDDFNLSLLLYIIVPVTSFIALILGFRYRTKCCPQKNARQARVLPQRGPNKTAVISKVTMVGVHSVPVKDPDAFQSSLNAVLSTAHSTYQQPRLEDRFGESARKPAEPAIINKDHTGHFVPASNSVPVPSKIEQKRPSGPAPDFKKELTFKQPHPQSTFPSNHPQSRFYPYSIPQTPVSPQTQMHLQNVQSSEGYQPPCINMQQQYSRPSNMLSTHETYLSRGTHQFQPGPAYPASHISRK